MEKKGNSCPNTLCKKICRAFNASPTFRRIRRISHPQNNSESANSITSNSNSTNKKAKPVDFVPITYDYSSQPPSQMPKAKNATVGQNPAAKSQVLRKPGGESGVHIEDRFTEFIHTARIKIGHFPDSERHKVSSGKNQKLSAICSMKDVFSDYIDRTKKKLGSTSDVGAGIGKTNSFK